MKGASARRSPGGAGRRRLIDLVLVERGLAESREKARQLIEAGAVEIGGVNWAKPGTRVDDGARIRILWDSADAALRYVGRGGLKLEAAIARFGLDLRGTVAADIGASTGGFTDCLLQHGAGRVYAIDVGYGQLAWALRNDPRVVVIERTNIRTMPASRLPEAVDWVVIDVAFISLTRVLPKAIELLKPGGGVVALVKPQFEVGRGEVGKGGVVRDEARREQALKRIVDFAGSLGLKCRGTIPSPISGQKGNIEYLGYFTT